MKDGERGEGKALRFRIAWRNGEYKVSIPNYEGGEVVEASAYDSSQATIRELVEALEGYATCGDGCTCGDGWDHSSAKRAIQKATKEWRL